jgi:hypothetical protein
MDDEDPDEGGPTGDQGAPPDGFSEGAGGSGASASASVGDSAVNPITTETNFTPQLTYDDQGNLVALEGDSGAETATIFNGDGTTTTESAEDFWASQSQGTLDNPDPTQMGESAYNEQRAQEGDTNTTTTPATQTPENPTNPQDGVNKAENVRNTNTKANGQTPGAGAVITQDGADPIEGYAGQNVPNPGFNVDNHPYDGGCAEVACASQAVTNIQSGTKGWSTGKRANMYVSQVKFEGPCSGCEDVAGQLASYLQAPVTISYDGGSLGIVTLPPILPGIIPFGK